MFSEDVEDDDLDFLPFPGQSFTSPLDFSRLSLLSLSLVMSASCELLLSDGPITTLGGVILLDVDMDCWTDNSGPWVWRCESDPPAMTHSLAFDDDDDDEDALDTCPEAPLPDRCADSDPPLCDDSEREPSGADIDLITADREDPEEAECALRPPVMVTGT